MAQALFTNSLQPSTPAAGVVSLFANSTDKQMYYLDDAGKLYGPIANDRRQGAAVASAATTNIWVNDGTYKHVTGSATITSFGTAPQAGAQVWVEFDGNAVLTNSASLILNSGGVNYTTSAGDLAKVIANTTTEMHVYIFKRDGTTVGPASTTDKIQPVTASVAANALTVGFNSTILDFRSTTLTSGIPVTRTVGASSLTVASGATLGTVNAVQARLVILAIDNAGTIEPAIVNLAGGVNLDETSLISTTALSGTSDSANVIYSTTARTNVAFRVMGYIDITEATAGTWATAPTEVQGVGGNTYKALPSFGMIRLNTANGYGSTNTVIRRFTNVVTNVGSDITYADSATLGASFTINTAGIYSISYSDQFNAVSTLGVSLNSNQLTTSIFNINVTNIVAVATTIGTGGISCANATLFLNPGDIIRAHASGAASGANVNGCQFIISRIT